MTNEVLEQVRDVKMQRGILERKIYDLCFSFETKTGLRVGNINVVQTTFTDHSQRIDGVKIDVVL